MKKSIYSKRHEVLIGCLVNARKTSGLTQQKLADRLGKPQSFVAKYENGERRLDVVEFIEIAEILDTDIAKIIGEMKRAVGA